MKIETGWMIEIQQKYFQIILPEIQVAAFSGSAKVRKAPR